MKGEHPAQRRARLAASLRKPGQMRWLSLRRLALSAAARYRFREHMPSRG